MKIVTNMKRRNYFSRSQLKIDSNKIEISSIFNEYSSFPNEETKKYLSKPTFLTKSNFPNIIQSVPAFLLDPRISIGLATSKQTTNDLLPGSFLEANTLFGMDIERFSHINDVENFAKNTSHCVINCLKSFYEEPIDFFIEIKKKQIFVNKKKISIQFKASSELCKVALSKTESLIINSSEKNEIIIRLVSREKQSEHYKSISIESDMPISLHPQNEDNESYFCTKLLRIICPVLDVNVNLKSSFFDLFISEQCGIIGDIICNKSFLVRTSNLSLQQTLDTSELIIVSIESNFGDNSILKTKNLCCIFADTSFKCFSRSINVSNNTFIKSKSILFKSNRKLKSTDQAYFVVSSNDENINEVNTDEPESSHNENDSKAEESDSSDSEKNDASPPKIALLDQRNLIQPTNIRQNCFLQGEKFAIGPNYSISSSTDFTIETRNLTLSQTSTYLTVSEKLYLLFLADKDQKTVGKSHGTISCNDLFIEMDSLDDSSVVNSIFENHFCLTAHNACLIESGIFANYLSSSIRSLYLSGYSQYKNLANNSVMTIGDLLTIEKDAEFVNNGKLRYFKTILPIILNSGKMTFLYNKKIHDFDSSYTIQCIKFISTGLINGNYCCIEANDLISISETIESERIILKAPEISFIRLADIIVSSFECRARTINFKNSNFRPMIKDNQTSITMYYENDIIGNNTEPRGFGHISFIQSKYID